MKFRLSILFAILLSASAFACKPKVIISVQHTPCFGKCPDYTITIYSNGYMEYDGGHFSARLGKFHRTISKKELSSLIKQFRDAEFFKFKDKYIEPVTDMPTTYISFTDKGKTKKITDYFNAPAALKKLEGAVNDYADLNEGWIEDAKKE